MKFSRALDGESVSTISRPSDRKRTAAPYSFADRFPVKNAEGKIVGASKIARDITEQKRSRDQIAMLAREAEHRSKNLLATVQAIVKLSHADKPDELKQVIEGRIQALANVLSLFVQSRWIGAELSTIASHELTPYSGKEGSRARMAGPPVVLKPDAAQAIAIILHELATNAAKYGALSSANGQIDLEWQHGKDGRLSLRWKETGGPAAQEPTRTGFGGRVIEQSIAQLKGETNFEWRKEGLICKSLFRCETRPQSENCRQLSLALRSANGRTRTFPNVRARSAIGRSGHQSPPAASVVVTPAATVERWPPPGRVGGRLPRRR